MSGTKRPKEEPSDGQNNHGHGPPPAKKMLVPFVPPEFDTHRIGPVASLEEMNIQVLRFQQKKLREKLAQRIRTEAEMRERIEHHEMRQTQGDAVLNVINRYWSQLNEDIGLLLQRFDTSSGQWGSPSEFCSEAATSFLTQLSTWDKEELDSKLVERVEMSTQAVGKIIGAFDRLQNRNEKITKALECTDSPGLSLEEAMKDATIKLELENQLLQAVNNHLNEQFRSMSLKRKELDDNLGAEETNTEELKEKVEDLEWEVSKLVAHNDKLINYIQEIGEKYRRLQQVVSAQGPSTSSEEMKLCVPGDAAVSDRDVRNLQKDNEELRELANNRLAELESLHHSHKDTLKDLERLRMEKKNLPESVIVETPAYKLLQSKFSVMYNESNQLRSSFEEARHAAAQMRSQQLKHNEHMESEELLMQKKLRTEMIQLEDMLCQVRQEYEMLRIEFEQNLTANEQTGPINREMRKLITSLQNHNQQSKGDASRSRRRYKEISLEMSRLKKERDNMEAKLNSYIEKDRIRRASRETEVGIKEEESPSSSSGDLPQPPQQQITDLVESSLDVASSAIAVVGTSSSSSGKPISIEKKIDVEALAICEKDQDLKLQLSKTLIEQRETKLLLDMYKGSGKDQRDKSQLVAAEKKSRYELEELRRTLKRCEEVKREEKKKLADVDAVKKIKALEEEVQALQKSLATQKAEEEALINEMEVTGQAFEEMQDQNGRLVTQLREKDDANFKLLSERVKSSNLHKLSKDELNTLQNQLQSLALRVDSQNMVVRKLEEKEMVVVNTISAMEKESSARLQASEGYKRKAVETAQSAYELTLHLEKYRAQMKDAQETVSVKTTALEAEAFNTKRLQEEIMGLRRKVERLNKIEMAGNSDEIMTEEIREYKETLTCPSCKVKRKDAVLTKCFHVFCFDCLRTRYETRQRKCPKCNAGFGVNDYHRLYLT